jgi:hypothetical protein
VAEGRRRKRKPCARDGCPRGTSRRRTYCFPMCHVIDIEFSRLQELYETAGDPSLNRTSWMALVDLNQQWTEFVGARSALFKDIVERGLPTPSESPLPWPASPDAIGGCMRR